MGALQQIDALGIGLGTSKIGQNIDWEKIQSKMREIVEENTQRKEIEVETEDLDESSAWSYDPGSITPDPYRGTTYQTFFVSDWDHIVPEIARYLNSVSIAQGIGTGEFRSSEWYKGKITKLRANLLMSRSQVNEGEYPKLLEAIGIFGLTDIWEECNMILRSQGRAEIPYPLS